MSQTAKPASSRSELISSPAALDFVWLPCGPEQNDYLPELDPRSERANCLPEGGSKNIATEREEASLMLTITLRARHLTRDFPSW
jgi:hypothetical protein